MWWGLSGCGTLEVPPFLVTTAFCLWVALVQQTPSCQRNNGVSSFYFLLLAIADVLSSSRICNDSTHRLRLIWWQQMTWNTSLGVTLWVVLFHFVFKLHLLLPGWWPLENNAIGLIDGFKSNNKQCRWWMYLDSEKLPSLFHVHLSRLNILGRPQVFAS